MHSDVPTLVALSAKRLRFAVLPAPEDSRWGGGAVCVPWGRARGVTGVCEEQLPSAVGDRLVSTQGYRRRFFSWCRCWCKATAAAGAALSRAPLCVSALDARPRAPVARRTTCLPAPRSLARHPHRSLHLLH